MNKLVMRKSMLLAALIIGVAPLTTACAMPAKKSVSQTQPLSQSYVWYDGERQQQVWLDPELVAEFGAKKDASTVRSLYPQAEALPAGRGNVTIYRLKGASVSDATRNLRGAQASGQFSPVLRDSADKSGPMRALPGHVIVKLNPGWDSGKVQSWLAQKDLQVVRKLEFAPNTYLIKSEPGLASLELANQLYKSGEVVAAMPDWWREVHTR
jgi:hypothetical protein